MQFRRLLGDGIQWGVKISYAVQETAIGIANGIEIALKTYETSRPSLVILGDNVFYGLGIGRNISEVAESSSCVVWTQKVNNPESFGILKKSSDGSIQAIVEKPREDYGNLAITGLYYFPADLSNLVGNVKKSARGEHEITEILNSYLALNRIENRHLSRGVYWIDAGTVENLLEAGQFVRSVQIRQGNLIGSPDEAAWRMGNITNQHLAYLVSEMNDSEYKAQLAKFVGE